MVKNGRIVEFKGGHSWGPNKKIICENIETLVKYFKNN